MAEFSENTDPDGRCVLGVSGEFDLAAVDDFLAAARQALCRCASLEVDLDRLAFIDSSGLGALIRLRSDAGAADTPLRLVNVGPRTHRLLELTGLLGVFDVRPSGA